MRSCIIRLCIRIYMCRLSWRLIYHAKKTPILKSVADWTQPSNLTIDLDTEIKEMHLIPSYTITQTNNYAVYLVVTLIVVKRFTA